MRKPDFGTTLLKIDGQKYDNRIIMMRAAVYRAGKGLVVEAVSMPRIEAEQVLVKVSHTGFCGSDHSMISSGGLPDGTILGHETCGSVVERGNLARGLPEGTRVIIRPTACGDCPDCKSGKPYFCQIKRRSIGIGDLPGAFAEYIVAYPEMLIPVPTGVDSQNAALAEAFAASLHAIKCTHRQACSALVVGGGPIGLALVRLLKILEFHPILLSEPVAEKREIGRTFGADHVMDPLTEDLNPTIFMLTEGKGCDVIFECSGVPALIQSCMDAAARGGTICVVSVMVTAAQITPLTLNFKEIWLTGSYSNTHAENIQCLDWMAEGKLDGNPLITDLISLDALPEVYEKRIDPGVAVKVMVDMEL
jgi:(R,R)-butanediol dehydrogenase/meso-butanediol dehydrogenase/diacetyl reductase